jgi:pimeloyl-[acyl-carrier protein] methyl ester esterase
MASDLAYEVVGAGPDLLLLHGWASSRRLWRELLPILSARYRCWLVDLPGHGGSAGAVPARFDAVHMAQAVETFCDARGLGPVTVCGHSMGGWLTLAFAGLYPERVTRAVAINPVVTGRVILDQLDWIPNSRAVFRRTHDLSRQYLEVVLPRLPEAARPLVRRLEDFNEASFDAMEAAWDMLVAGDLRPILPQVQAPTLIILGSYDVNVPNSEGLTAVAHLGDAHLIVFASGHTITDRHPRAVADAMLAHAGPVP